MTLKSPTGVVIAPTTTDPNVTHDNGVNYEYYDIDKPESGTWTVILEGTDLPFAGEDVTVTASFVPEAVPDDVNPPNGGSGSVGGEDGRLLWPVLAAVLGAVGLVLSGAAWYGRRRMLR